MNALELLKHINSTAFNLYVADSNNQVLRAKFYSGRLVRLWKQSRRLGLDLPSMQVNFYDGAARGAYESGKNKQGDKFCKQITNIFDDF